ncbi:MAG: acetate kinase, partial [Planctomycetes bacterium]|nr:acetate kinase [Planctomycetota bacterium]
SYIGAYLAVLGRVDAICFTGGIGENGPKVRAASVSNLENYGIALDQEKNKDARGREVDLSMDGSKIKILVIPTDEEGWIAEETYNLCK